MTAGAGGGGGGWRGGGSRDPGNPPSLQACCMARDSQYVLTTVPYNGCEAFMNLKVK